MGNLRLSIACDDCGAEFEINPDSIAVALVLNTTLWDYLDGIQHFWCTKCSAAKKLESKISDIQDDLAHRLREVEKSSAGNVTEWISVTDHLPREGENISVWIKYPVDDLLYYCFYSHGRYLEAGWKVYFKGQIQILHNEITHWMPLPSPPSQNER